MCVSMSVRGIFEFDQPVNSVSVHVEIFRSSRFTLVIGKFILQKKTQCISSSSVSWTISWTKQHYASPSSKRRRRWWSSLMMMKLLNMSETNTWIFKGRNMSYYRSWAKDKKDIYNRSENRCNLIQTNWQQMIYSVSYSKIQLWSIVYMFRFVHS